MDNVICFYSKLPNVKFAYFVTDIDNQEHVEDCKQCYARGKQNQKEIAENIIRDAILNQIMATSKEIPFPDLP